LAVTAAFQILAATISGQKSSLPTIDLNQGANVQYVVVAGANFNEKGCVASASLAKYYKLAPRYKFIAVGVNLIHQS
jgi:hypothetical protein